MNDSLKMEIPLRDWFSNSHCHIPSQSQSQGQGQNIKGSIVNVMLHTFIGNKTSFQVEDKIVSSFLDFEVPLNSGFSFGFHPWYLEDLDLDEAEYLLRMISSSQCCRAIGETGLDGVRGVNQALQLAFFRIHCSVASSAKKPLVIHCVRKHQEVINEIRASRFGGGVMVHGFSSRWAVASMWLASGAMLSFGEALISGSNALKEAFIKCPIERLLLETDDSTVEIAAIYRQAAMLRSVDLEELRAQVNRNYTKFYNG